MVLSIPLCRGWRIEDSWKRNGERPKTTGKPVSTESAGRGARNSRARKVSGGASLRRSGEFSEEQMWSKRKRGHQDFNEEIQAHIAIEAERLIEEGMTPEDARAAAVRRFGNTVAAEERFYEVKRILWLDHIGQDVRYALRGLRRNPMFSIVAILTLAIGIGANTAVFSLIDPLFFEKLPVLHPQELVSITTARPDLRTINSFLSGPLGAKLTSRITYREFQGLKNSNILAGIFVVRGASGGLRLLDADGELNEGSPSIALTSVSSGAFETLGTVPAFGRWFTAEEDRHGAPPVGIISYTLWQTRFNLDPSVLGKTITVLSPARGFN